MAEQLEQIILNLLVPDSGVIAQATVQLQELAKSPEIVVVLCQLISISSRTEVRQYAAVLLRKKILKKKQWRSLSPEICENIRQNVFDILLKEQEQSVKKSIVQLIATIAKHDIPEGKWLALYVHLMDLGNNEVLSKKEIGVCVLSAIASVAHKELEPQVPGFINVCGKGLNEKNNHMIQYHSLRALTHIISSVTYLSTDSFLALLPSIFEAIKNLILIDEDLAGEAMGFFDELISSDQFIVSPQLKNCIQFNVEIAKNPSFKTSLRNVALSILCDAIEKKKKTILKLNIMPALISELFVILCEEDIEISDEEDCSVSSTAAQVFAQMALHLPPEKYIPPLLKHIEPAFESLNPKIRAGAFMAIAVSTEGCSENLKNKHMKKLLKITYKGMSDENEKVKSAAMYTLAEFSEFFQPDINKFSQELLPLLFDCLGKMSADVNAERNDLARVYYAIEKFCENLGKDILLYLSQLIEFLVTSAQNSQSYDIKELSISAIGATAESAREDIVPYLPRILDLLKGFLSPTNEEGPLKVQVQSLDTLSILLSKAGKQNETLASDCFTMAMNLIDEADDPELRGAIYKVLSACWIVLKEKLSEHVPKVFVMLRDCLKSVEGISATFHDDETNFVSDIFDDEEEEEGIGSNEDEDGEQFQNSMKSLSLQNSYMNEKIDALTALGELALNSGLAFLPHFEESYKECLELLVHPDANVVRFAAFCATDLCCAAKELADKNIEMQNNLMSGLNVMLASTVPKLIETVRIEVDREIVIAVLDCLNKLIKNVGSPVLRAAGSHHELFNLVKDVLKQKISCQSQEVDDDDEDEAEYDSLLIENAGDILPALASLAPHKDFIAFYNTMLPDFLKRAKKSATVSDKSFAIGNMAETMHKLGKSGAVFTMKIYPVMMGSVKDEDEEVRNNAIYGLGILAAFGGSAILNHYNEILNTLSDSLSKESDRRVIDNICGAVCRMMTTSTAAVPVGQILPTILNYLPLQVDLEEHPTVFHCFATLHAQNNSDIMPLLPSILTIAGVLLNTELKPDFKIQLANFVNEVYKNNPDAFGGVTDEQAVQALKTCLQYFSN